MHIRKTRSWELPDSAVTPEADYLRRREFLRTVGLALAATPFFAFGGSRSDNWLP
jgi:hypothetical protein